MEQELTLLQRVQRLEEQMADRIKGEDQALYNFKHQKGRIDGIIGSEPEGPTAASATAYEVRGR